MASPTVSNLVNLPDESLIYKWDVKFIGNPAGITAPDINVRCETLTLPIVTNEGNKEIFIRGKKIPRPGIMTRSGEMTLTCIETIDATMFDFIQQVEEAMSAQDTGLSALPISKMLFALKINLLDKNDQAWYYYDLQSCFLSSVENGGDPDGSTSDPYKPVLTIAYSTFKKGKL